MAEEPLPGHREFTISVDFSVVIITICSVCLTYAQEQKNKVFKDVMYFHYLTFLTTPQHRNPYPRGHEINNFGRPFLCNHHYMLLLSGLFRGVQKNLKKNNVFSLFDLFGHILAQESLSKGPQNLQFWQTLPCLIEELVIMFQGSHYLFSLRGIPTYQSNLGSLYKQ